MSEAPTIQLLNKPFVISDRSLAVYADVTIDYEQFFVGHIAKLIFQQMVMLKLRGHFGKIPSIATLETVMCIKITRATSVN